MDETSSVPGVSSSISVVADIVAAYVANNSIRPTDLPDLIKAVHTSIELLARGKAMPDPIIAPEPAISIKKSITPDHLICLDDGKKFTSLRRHLGKLGMTPDEYRAKWGLPKDYPMVAPSYSAKRSELAKSSGLGQVRSQETKAANDTMPKGDGVPKKRGRPKKVIA